MTLAMYRDEPPEAEPIPRPEESVRIARHQAETRRIANADAPACPWPNVDALLGPLGVGQVTIVTAGTGAGKTTTALNWVTQSLQCHGVPFWYLGTEMPAVRLWRTWAAMLEGVPASTAVTETWDRLEVRQLQRIDGIRRFHDGPEVPRLWLPAEVRDTVLRTERQLQERYGEAGAAHFLDHPSPTPAAVGQAMHAAANAGARLVVIDHLSRLEAGDWYSDKKRGVEYLVSAAQAAHVHVLLLVQQNRDVRKGNHLTPYQPPLLTGLEGGGYVEQNADAVLGFWRPIRARREDETFDDYQELRRRCEKGDEKPGEILERNVMGCALLKHRAAPPDVTVGDRTTLLVHHGRISVPVSRG